MRDSFMCSTSKTNRQFSTQIICIGEVEASRFDVLKTIYNGNNKFIDNVLLKKETDSVNLLMMGQLLATKGHCFCWMPLKNRSQICPYP